MNGQRKEKLKALLGQIVKVKIDRPLGSAHPKYKDMIYPINYGYLPDILGGDGEGQDAYILGGERSPKRI